MGVTVTYSYNAEFADIPNGFSFVGQAKFALTKACAVSGLEWSIQNGILQVKEAGGRDEQGSVRSQRGDPAF